MDLIAEVSITVIPLPVPVIVELRRKQSLVHFNRVIVYIFWGFIDPRSQLPCDVYSKDREHFHFTNSTAWTKSIVFATWVGAGLSSSLTDNCTFDCFHNTPTFRHIVTNWFFSVNILPA